MWNKSVLAVMPTLRYLRSRLVHQNVRSISNGSYLHNPGSSPLQYITLGDMLEQTANKYPERLALRSVHEDLTLTYEQMFDQAQRLGCALRSQGLKKGDRLGIWSHNTASSIVALIAAVQVGLIPVEINPMYEKSELSFCIKKAGLNSIFLCDKLPNRNYYEVLCKIIPELRNSKEGDLQTSMFPELKSVIVDSKEKLAGAFNFNSLIKDYSSNGISKYFAEVSPDDGAIIHFTSGTTGAPKAAESSHFAVVNNSRCSGHRSLLHDGEQKVCVQVPLFHALGTILTVFSAYNHGAGLVLSSPTYSTKANLHTIINEKCTCITGTPTMYVDLLSLVRQTGARIDTLQMLLTAGAPCSPQLIHDIKNELHVQSVKALYGMTEASGGVCQSIEGENIETIAETVGYIMDHVEIKVVDENDKIVPFGSEGEALVRGYLTMMGYWDDPEKTRKALGADGWLRTGDKFILSEDGYGRIVGRIKDIIVRGGENIAPKEIEDHLNTHPDIVDSQVIGVADERLGEELCAVIRVKEGSQFTENDLKAHCSGKLSKFKIPRILKTIDEFPKTASGKVQKFKLKDLIEAGKL